MLIEQIERIEWVEPKMGEGEQLANQQGYLQPVVPAEMIFGTIAGVPVGGFAEILAEGLAVVKNPPVVLALPATSV